MNSRKSTQTRIQTSLSALALLAIASFAPACDVFNPHPCDPHQEICPVSGHPDTLAPAN